jgi:hypothetical protein
MLCPLESLMMGIPGHPGLQDDNMNRTVCESKHAKQCTALGRVSAAPQQNSVSKPQVLLDC